MSENLSLGSSQFTRMLEVLVAEQVSLKRHFLWYRLQKAAFYAMTIAMLGSALLLIVHLLGGPLSEALYFGLVAIAVSFLALVPLFFINLPLAWKLFRQERLRRRLGLHEGLRERFKLVRKKRRWMIVLSVLGVLAATGGAIGIIEEIRGHDHGPLIGLAKALWLPFCFLIGGLSIPSLWLMSRGVDRLEVVSRLRDRLQSEVNPKDARAERIEVSAADYDQVARLEKMRSVAERDRSVVAGVKLAKASIYAVQRSAAAQAAIERLDKQSRMRVEEAIFDLMSKPRPRQAREHGGELLSLGVPDSPLVLSYQVIDPGRRIRLYEVWSAEAQSEL